MVRTQRPRSQRVDEAFAYIVSPADTLLDAVSYKSKKDPAGGRTLLRTGVAAVLNAVRPDVAYPHATAEIVDPIDSALAVATEESS